MNLPNYEMYLNGSPLKPFSATTVPWSELPTAFVAAPTAADTDVA